jgi:hypothetical protein
MKKKIFVVALLSVVLLFVVLLVFDIGYESDNNIDSDNKFSLSEPLFITRARADNSEIGQYLDEEAGISLWYLSEYPIDLDDIKPEYRIIEIETQEYVIGSVEVPNYGELDDVHVYVHTDGWILVYYLNEDPISKILDLKSTAGRDLTTNILQIILEIMTTAAGVPLNSATFYNFRYPNATEMMLIVEIPDSANYEDPFEIFIPGSYLVFERSWKMYSTCGGFGNIKVDGNLVASGTGYGLISASLLTQDEWHTVTVANTNQFCSIYGGIALAYMVP